MWKPNHISDYLFLLGIAVCSSSATIAFNPAEYTKSSVTCTSVRRGEASEIVDIRLSYVEINSKAPETLVMVHGWPSLWSSWSNQILEFQDDYHLIVPELRGFGESSHPGKMRTSGAMGDIVGDLVCILENAKVSSVICMGHDWGSQICYEAARARPDIFKAVVGAVVPYIAAAGPFIPIEELVPLLPKLAYQISFDRNTEAAVAELDKDIKRSLRATLRTVASPPPSQFLQSKDSFLEGWNDVKEIPPIPFFTQDEEDYFVQQYSIQGFKNTLYFYMHENRYRSWEEVHVQGNFTISQPVLAIYPTEDPVADWLLAASLLKTSNFIPNLTTKTMKGSHWLHLEFPEVFNDIVRKWLEKEPKNGNGAHASNHARFEEEL